MGIVYECYYFKLILYPSPESRFESANLLKASRVADGEYELELRTDLYTDRHTQWFYFQVNPILLTSRKTLGSQRATCAALLT